MFLLDTNVVSELMRMAPDPAVEAWVGRHPIQSLFFSAIGESELRYGAAILPAGRCRGTLVSEIEMMLRAAFENRILPFDTGAARAYASLAAKRRLAGCSVVPADCQNAAIARTRGMAVATRNVGDFEGMGIEILNPWGGE